MSAGKKHDGCPCCQQRDAMLRALTSISLRIDAVFASGRAIDHQWLAKMWAASGANAAIAKAGGE